MRRDDAKQKISHELFAKTWRQEPQDEGLRSSRRDPTSSDESRLDATRATSQARFRLTLATCKWMASFLPVLIVFSVLLAFFYSFLCSSCLCCRVFSFVCLARRLAVETCSTNYSLALARPSRLLRSQLHLLAVLASGRLQEAYLCTS